MRGAAALTAAGLSLAFGLPSAAGLADPVSSPSAEAGFVRLRPEELVWRPVPGGLGATSAVLFGDPSKAGFYVIRVRFPAHVMDRPHVHPHDRYVTVLEGTWWTGTGPVFDPDRAVPLGPGGVMKHPAGGVHWDGSAGDGATVVQIVGEGPASSVQLDPRAPAFVSARRSSP